jgi:hypothetical protein
MFKRYVPAAAGILYAVAILLSAPIASAEGDHVTPVFAKRLPNVPAKNLTAVVVVYPPGGKSVSHHHAGSVLAKRAVRRHPVAELGDGSRSGFPGRRVLLRATRKHPPHQRECKRY